MMMINITLWRRYCYFSEFTIKSSRFVSYKQNFAMEKLRIIITGATGMVGEGVLYECLQHKEVEKVLVIGRKSCGYSHPKLSEIILSDFADIATFGERLSGYNACFFCLGTTAMGKDEAEYSRQTYALTLNFATELVKHNSDMSFCYVSGAGTDSTEKGRIMWARVKGRTENDLMKLPFKQVFNFRPAGIEPFLPLKPSQTYYKMYKYLGWLFPMMKVIAPNSMVAMKDIAAAMIHVSLYGFTRANVEVKDMKELAKAVTGK